MGRRGIEEVKAGVDLDAIWARILRWSREGWEAIPEEERDLPKWYGVFFRKVTPGFFMIRTRISGGVLERGRYGSSQLRVLAEVARRYGWDVLDLTTRQGVQLRGFQIQDIPQVLQELWEAGIETRQTGFDNVRIVTSCPLAGLAHAEVMDSRPFVQAVTRGIVGHWAYANLPRKFNITVLGSVDGCTSPETNDIAFTPARRNGRAGFNVWVGGAEGSWGSRRAQPLRIFVPPEPERVAEVALRILDIFIAHGNRQSRNRARLAFLLDEWGLDRFRSELLGRLSFPAEEGGAEYTVPHLPPDHVGITPQKTAGLYAVGLLVPTGRMTTAQALELARLAETYGSGEVRLTPKQNPVIVNVPETRLEALLAEPLLRTFSPFPLPFRRGLVTCTGNTYCHFAVIETKDRGRELAEYLDRELGEEVREKLGVLHLHVSGCPNSCGHPHTGQIGLIGKRIRLPDGQVVEGADIYVGGEPGLFGAFNERWRQGVPFQAMGPLLADLVRRYLAEREEGEGFHPWCVRAGLIQGAQALAAPMLQD